MRIIAVVVMAVFCLVGVVLAQGQVLTNEQVVTMRVAGLGDEIIVLKIKSSPADFKLDVEDVIALKKAGVSDAVIRVMFEASAKRGGALQMPHPAAVSTSDLGGRWSGTLNLEAQPPDKIELDVEGGSVTIRILDSGTGVLLVGSGQAEGSAVVFTKGRTTDARYSHMTFEGNLTCERATSSELSGKAAFRIYSGQHGQFTQTGTFALQRVSSAGAASGTTLTQTSPAVNSWKGMVLDESTPDDAMRLLGTPKEDKPSERLELLPVSARYDLSGAAKGRGYRTMKYKKVGGMDSVTFSFLNNRLVAIELDFDDEVDPNKLPQQYGIRFEPTDEAGEVKYQEKTDRFLGDWGNIFRRNEYYLLGETGVSWAWAKVELLSFHKRMFKREQHAGGAPGWVTRMQLVSRSLEGRRLSEALR